MNSIKYIKSKSTTSKYLYTRCPNIIPTYPNVGKGILGNPTFYILKKKVVVLVFECIFMSVPKIYLPKCQGPHCYG